MTTLEKPTLAPAALQRQLEKPAPLDKKLALVHDVVRHYSDDIHRIAVALYDQDTDEISTFLYSSHENSPLLNYSVKLAQVPSLQEVARQGLRLPANFGYQA